MNIYMYICTYKYMCGFVGWSPTEVGKPAIFVGFFQGTPKPQIVPLGTQIRPPGPSVTLLDLCRPRLVSALLFSHPRGLEPIHWRMFLARRWTKVIIQGLRWINSHWSLFLLDEHPHDCFHHSVLRQAMKPTSPRSYGVSCSEEFVAHQKF